MKNRNKDINMLEGPLLGKVIGFILPLIATNMLQVLYNAADMVIAGMSGVPGAIGSIGTTAAMINLILNIFMGFSVGTNVVVARSIGRGDRDATSAAVHSSLIVGLITGFICSIICFFVSRPVLSLLGDRGHVLELASLYTKIYSLGIPFMALSNFLIAIFRAKGDTRTPLYVLSASGLLNVVLNCFFVLVCGMSVDGVAYATVISNAVSMALLAIVLSRDTGWCRLEMKKLRLHRSAVKEIIRDGLPAGIQGALFSLSNMLIQSSIIGFNNELCPGGSDIIDGNAAASSLEAFIYVATNSVYQAAVTFTSQHHGARKYKRIGLVMRCCYLVTGAIAVIGTLILMLFHTPLLKLYVDSENAISTALIRMDIMIIPYFLLAFMEVGSGVLRGLGRSTTSTVVSLIGSCLFRIVWIQTVCRIFHSLEAVYLSYPISWGLTALAHFLISMRIRRHYMAEYPEEVPSTNELPVSEGE